MTHVKTDIIVIGAGPVGLFAVFQAGMLGMKCHVVDGLSDIGGQCTALYPEKPIYDIPSRPVVTGAELIENLKEQAAPFDPVYHLGQQVMSVEKQGDGWVIQTTKNQTLRAKVIIIAAGAGAFVPNRPPLNNIEMFEGESVFYFVKDKSRFTGKDVVIAGGGDSAVDWAIALHGIAGSVSVVHRRDKFRAMSETVEQMHRLSIDDPDHFKIYTPYQLVELYGNAGVLKSIKLTTLDGDEKEVKADFLLALYGLKTELGPIKTWGLQADGQTLSVHQSTCETSQQGIYAVGDVASYDGKLKLILTGFAEVASACHHAYRYVYPDKALHFEYSTTKGVHLTGYSE